MGGAESDLAVTFKGNLGGFVQSGDPCKVTVNPVALVDFMTLDGEDILDAWTAAYGDDPQSVASVEGATFDNNGYWLYPLTSCQSGQEAEVTITYMYNGASTTETGTITATNPLG